MAATGSSQREERLAQLCEIAGVGDEDARVLLEATQWSVEEAVALHFARVPGPDEEEQVYQEAAALAACDSDPSRPASAAPEPTLPFWRPPSESSPTGEGTQSSPATSQEQPGFFGSLGRALSSLGQVIMGVASEDFEQWFANRYGEPTPTFSKACFGDAVRGALSERRLLLLWFHQEESIATENLCRNILQNELVLEMISGSYNLWAGDVGRFEPNQIARLLSITIYPTLVVCQPLRSGFDSPSPGACLEWPLGTFVQPLFRLSAPAPGEILSVDQAVAALTSAAEARFQSIIGVGPPEMPPAEAWKKTLTTVKDITNTVQQAHPVEQWQVNKVGTDLDFSYEMSKVPTMLTNYNVSMFSVCLLPHPGSPGYFVWGDPAAVTRPELFRTVPVMGKHTWTVQMRNVQLRPRSLATAEPKYISCANGCGAILDSGTSLLMVPAAIVGTLEEALSALGADCTNMQDLPDIAFTLGTHTFSLPPDAYLAEVEKADSAPSAMAAFGRIRTLTSKYGDCQISVMESYSSTDWGPLWILGMPFFRKYYTTFNIGRNHSERALHIAQATPDCYPMEHDSSLARDVDEVREVYRRKVDVSQMYFSPLVKQATNGGLLSL